MARNISAYDGQRIAAPRRSQALAAGLADFARHLCSLVLLELGGTSSTRLTTLYQQARAEVWSELSHDDFADLLAQVLVYCCLLVRCSSQERHKTFARALHAFLELPALPPFVSHLLKTLWRSAENERDELTGCVQNLVAFVRATDIQMLLEKPRSAHLQGDALVYFYEMFLTAYAPGQRSQCGVYYTPAPVIAYMVKAIDELLRGAFAYPGGLSEALRDEQQAGGVFLCDPACGTGAFLWGIVNYVHQAECAPTGTADGLRGPPAHIQPRLSGCEVMPAAYVLACIELATRQAALDLPADERANRTIALAQSPPNISVRISLANALVDGRLLALPNTCLPVILGNPPYAGHSLNHSDWLGHLLESYKTGDAGLKKPAQAKWLNDDYVQFLRLAQWQVEQAGRGIVAFLTSHSYLDNPTFRAMRLSLLRSFDEIYILDLHGNSKRRELAPGGGRDRNIFTIQQGVAIGIFVKRADQQRSTNDEVPGAEQAQCEHNSAPHARRDPTSPQAQCDPTNPRGWRDSAADPRAEEHLATVYYADVWGAKALYAVGEDGARHLSGGKLGWLARHDLSSTPWQVSHPSAPFYVFTPRDERYQAEYMAHWSLPAIFALNGDPAPGLVTCHDEFAISWNAAEAEAKIATLLATNGEAEARSLFRLCAQGQWDYTTARSELEKNTWRGSLGRVHYRPFDTRWTVFERHVAVHLRERVTRHMRAGPNLALAVGRAGQVIDGGDNWDIAFCTRLPTEFNLYRRGGNYLFPLYLYPLSGAARVANLAPQFIAEVCQRLPLNWLPDGSGDLLATFGPDDIFAYIYALLYAPSYRTRYANFLKIDFPRIPLPTHSDLFRVLCLSGRALSQAHLLEQPLPTDVAWSQTGNNLVAHVRYLADEHGGSISINAHQYLTCVPSNVWALTIGGHQVAKKWLWDRRGHQLSADELAQYCQIIASLIYTRKMMADIDSALAYYGGWPL